MRTPWWFPFGSVPGISADELLERLEGEEPPQLLDVRSASEFAADHVSGAVHVPISELRQRLQRGLALDPGKLVVAICLSAHRSIPAVRLLERAGFVDARQLTGGMRAFRERR